MSSWNLEGLRVFGKYMGEFPVSGIVGCSRVAYGGGVVHNVVLDKPISVYGAAKESVNLEHYEIERIAGSFS